MLCRPAPPDAMLSVLCRPPPPPPALHYTITSGVDSLQAWPAGKSEPSQQSLTAERRAAAADASSTTCSTAQQQQQRMVGISWADAAAAAPPMGVL